MKELLPENIAGFLAFSPHAQPSLKDVLGNVCDFNVALQVFDPIYDLWQKSPIVYQGSRHRVIAWKSPAGDPIIGGERDILMSEYYEVMTKLLYIASKHKKDKTQLMAITKAYDAVARAYKRARDLEG